MSQSDRRAPVKMRHTVEDLLGQRVWSRSLLSSATARMNRRESLCKAGGIAGLVSAPKRPAARDRWRRPAGPDPASRPGAHARQGGVDAAVGLQGGQIAPRHRRADGGELRLGAAGRLAGPFGRASGGAGALVKASSTGWAAASRSGSRPTTTTSTARPAARSAACVSPHVRTPLGATSSAWTKTNVARSAPRASGSLWAK